MQGQLIRIHYPTNGGSIALRTEEDWDSNIQAHFVRQNGCISEFRIETERPYFYFKPVLLCDGVTMWSRGESFLAIPTSGAPLQIYPYFREDTRCSVCELMPPLAGPSGAEHRFRVFLLPGYYENTLKKYPVLYMHDGHNLFFKEEAFVGNTWRTDEVLNMLDKMNAIEEVIVVGIHPNDRMTEYTLPGYYDYGRFLVETLKPLIDVKYRTLEGPRGTAVMGSSLGGVVSFYLDGNGRRSLAKLPAYPARLLIGTIYCSAFPKSQREKPIFISIAGGRATTTKLLAACEIVLSGKDIVPVPSSSTWHFQKRNTTRMHGPRAARYHSNFCSENFPRFDENQFRELGHRCS